MVAGVLSCIPLVLLIPAQAGLIGPLGVLVGFGYGAIRMLGNAGRMQGRPRLAWRLIGVGLASAASGVLAVGLIQVGTGSVHTFGPTDIFFVMSYVLTIAGVFVLPHAVGRWSQRLLILADGLVGAISLATVSWILLLSDLSHTLREAPEWHRILGSVYPVLDVAFIIVVSVYLLRRTSLRFDLRLILLVVALTAQAIGDLAFLRTALGVSFAEAQPIFPVFLLSAAALAALGCIANRDPVSREYPDRPAPWWSLVMPYVASVIMLGLFLSQLQGDASTDLQLLGLTSFTVAVIVIARQGVAIRENRNRVEEERRALVSSISHELRTPLTSMLGFVEVLREGVQLAPEEHEDIMSIVSEQIQYVSRIVSDLVMLARGTTAPMVLKKDNVRIAGVIEMAVLSLETGGIGVVTEVEARLTANLDGQRLQQILLNLITNAERYGGGKCLVSAFSEGTDLVVEVHDNGIGVAPKYQVVVWDRFERGSHRFDARVPGAGIGLAIVAAVAQAHGGMAGYRRSGRLGGSCFFVRFPEAIIVEPMTSAALGLGAVR